MVILFQDLGPGIWYLHVELLLIQPITDYLIVIIIIIVIMIITNNDI